MPPELTEQDASPSATATAAAPMNSCVRMSGPRHLGPEARLDERGKYLLLVVGPAGLHGDLQYHVVEGEAQIVPGVQHLGDVGAHIREDLRSYNFV